MAESLSERVTSLEQEVSEITQLLKEANARFNDIGAWIHKHEKLNASTVVRSDPGYVDPDFTKGVNTNG